MHYKVCVKISCSPWINTIIMGHDGVLSSWSCWLNHRPQERDWTRHFKHSVNERPDLECQKSCFKWKFDQLSPDLLPGFGYLHALQNLLNRFRKFAVMDVWTFFTSSSRHHLERCCPPKTCGATAEDSGGVGGPLATGLWFIYWCFTFYFFLYRFVVSCFSGVGGRACY